MILKQEVTGLLERLLNIKDVGVIGLLLVLIAISWLVIWQFWKYNKELTEKLIEFTEKYSTLSTKILGFLSKGRDV